MNKPDNDSEALNITKADIAVDRLRYHGLTAEYRVKYGIPQFGFSTIENAENWLIQLQKDYDKYTHFQADINHLAGEIEYPIGWEIGLQDYLLMNMYTYSAELLVTYTPYNKTKSSKEIVIRILPTTRIRHVRDNWEHTIVPLQNKLYATTRKARKGVEVQTTNPFSTTNDYLAITIYEKTSKTEFVGAWSKIFREQRKLIGYSRYDRLVSKYEIGREAYKLYKAKTSYKKIRRKLMKRFPDYKTIRGNPEENIGHIGAILDDYKTLMRLKKPSYVEQS